MKRKIDQREKEREVYLEQSNSEEWFEVVSQFLVELRKEAEHEK